MKCPQCGLTNPPSAQRCDCGWDFSTGRWALPYAARARRDPAPLNFVGCLGTLVGTTVLLVLVVWGAWELGFDGPAIGLGCASAAWVWTLPASLVLRRRWPDLAFGISVGGGALFLLGLSSVLAWLAR